LRHNLAMLLVFSLTGSGIVAADVVYYSTRSS